MVDRKKKTRGAIRRLLYEEESDQLSLFEVSDTPLRKAVFEDSDKPGLSENCTEPEKNTDKVEN